MKREESPPGHQLPHSVTHVVLHTAQCPYYWPHTSEAMRAPNLTMW